MRSSLPNALIAAGVGVLLIAGGFAANQSFTPSLNQASTEALANSPVQLATEDPTGPLLPNVVTTATKLGQGRKAFAGMPVSEHFDRPSVRSTSAGTALVIPGSELPAGDWSTELSALPPLTSGGKPRLKFDIYSWSLGTLVATTPHWIDLGDDGTTTRVPEPLLRQTTALTSSARLLQVLAPGQIGSSVKRGDIEDRQRQSAQQPLATLDPLDAYIVVADILVP